MLVVTLKPGMRLTANKDLDRIVCVLRINSTTDDQILVPLSVKGSTQINGGEMSIAITTNSGANVLSTAKENYTATGKIDITNLFEASDSPQCGSSTIVGANINLYGTNGSIDLNDIRFTLKSRTCQK